MLASGSAIPGQPSPTDSDSIDARSDSPLEVRGEYPELRMGGIGGEETFAIKGNLTFQSYISSVPDKVEACVVSAAQDALQSLVDAKGSLQSADLTDVITTIQTNSDNIGHGDSVFCNEVIVKCWINVQDKNCFLNWVDLTSQNNLVQNFASQIVTQMYSDSVQVCGLPWVAGEGWCGGMVCTILGVDDVFGMFAEYNDPDWPSDSVMSQCGGETSSSTYFGLMQTPCQTCA